MLAEIMENKKTLTNRWTTELKGLHSEISNCLKGNSSFEKININKTLENLFDLRGFYVTKTTLFYGSKQKIKIQDGPNIKNKTFNSFDFSGADFKNCSFHNCNFINSKFDKTKLNESYFWNCSFSNCKFYKTIFNYCTFNKSLNLFRKVSFNFKDNTFKNVSFLETHFYKQVILNSVFLDNNLKATILTKCKLENITFQGQVVDFFIKQNKSAQNVRFSNSKKEDINFIETDSDNFTFME